MAEPVASVPAPVPPPVIVLIEDEPQIRRFLRATLGTQGYRLLEATSGEDGLIEAATRQPDVVILDLGLPDLDGLEVIRRLREWSRVPIIVLSARGQERDKVAALDAGADDYVSKPFAVGELLARLRVALRHAARRASRVSPPSRWASLRVDLVKRQVQRRRQGGPPDPDRVPAADYPGQARRPGPDPAAAIKGGVGARAYRPGPLPPGLHGRTCAASSSVIPPGRGTC